MKNQSNKITALYPRLSRDDDVQVIAIVLKTRRSSWKNTQRNMDF